MTEGEGCQSPNRHGNVSNVANLDILLAFVQKKRKKNEVEVKQKRNIIEKEEIAPQVKIV